MFLLEYVFKDYYPCENDQFVLCTHSEPNLFQLFNYQLDNIVLNILEMLHCHKDHIKIFQFPHEH